MFSKLVQKNFSSNDTNNNERDSWHWEQASEPVTLDQLSSNYDQASASIEEDRVYGNQKEDYAKLPSLYLNLNNELDD